MIYQTFPLEKVFPTNQDLSHWQELLTYYFKFEEADNNLFLQLVKNQYVKEYGSFNNDDEVKLLLNRYQKMTQYSRSSSSSHNTLDLLCYIADELLFYQGNQVTVSFDHLLEWNGFINKIDANILLAMKAAITQKKITSRDSHKIRHDNDRLTTILKKGLSENHMHLKGSGYTSDLNWLHFSLPNTTSDKRMEEILEKREGKFNDTALSFYKARTIKAYLLQKILKDKNLLCDDYPEFDNKSQSDDDSKFDKKSKCNKDFELDSLDMKKLLFAQTIDEYYIYYTKSRDAFFYLSEKFEEIYQQFKKTPKQSFLVERQFLKDLFDIYLNNGLNDFETYLLNAYLLSLNKFKQFFNQNNEGMGFEKFKESEEIKETFIDEKTFGEASVFNKIVESVFDKYYSEGSITKVEFRIAPKESVAKYNEVVKKIKALNDKQYKAHSRYNPQLKKIQFGLIIHYIKDGKPLEPIIGSSRHEELYEKIKATTDVLVTFFEESEYAKKVVGVDTANYELNTRPELYGTSFRRVRQEVAESHNLYFTYHVGEDFLTIANGLRAIDETLEFLDYQRGDRLGHAMALGLNIDDYFATKGHQIYSSVGDYIDDIVWMYHLIQEDRLHHVITSFEKENAVSVSSLLHFLESEFKREYFRYKDRQITLFDYFSSYKLRGDEPSFYIDYCDKDISPDEFEGIYSSLVKKHHFELNSGNAYHKSSFQNKTARNLYFNYHYNHKHKMLYSDLQDCYPASELYIQSVKLAQALLREKIYQLEIGIETNPSSNLKISFVKKYTDLPFLTFNNRYISDNKAHPLSISINTDDSAVFQTDLSQEYAYVAAALFRENYNREQVYDYINYVRKMSQAQSFVKDNPTTYKLWRLKRH
ncbi:hypothetical protein [Streptococcus sp. CSL10205-OR2]|uniref:hypothetical protein n=1 Tax=Streptococcus sp. CSL10205-OR2 TaxID=2980558 RepID=UPI0021D9483A|nr:hypothetical protein [Streptococcus sp. CSL10205-OR2]